MVDIYKRAASLVVMLVWISSRQWAGFNMYVIVIGKFCDIVSTREQGFLGDLAASEESLCRRSFAPFLLKGS